MLSSILLVADVILPLPFMLALIAVCHTHDVPLFFEPRYLPLSSPPPLPSSTASPTWGSCTLCWPHCPRTLRSWAASACTQLAPAPLHAPLHAPASLPLDAPASAHAPSHSHAPAPELAPVPALGCSIPNTGGIWIGQNQYRLPLAPLNQYPEPWC